MAEYSAVFDDKNISDVRGADHLIVKKFLKPDTVIQKNVIGSVEAQAVGDIFRPGDGSFDQACSVAMGDNLRDNQPADDDQDCYSKQEGIFKTFRFHLPF